MPNPYRGKYGASFGEEAFTKRPELAAHIGLVASLWTLAEEAWGLVLAEMLDAEAKTGLALYESLVGAASQNAVLNAAADLRLSGKTKEAFVALLQRQKGLARERNRIVHGRWGYVPEDDSILILGERNWLPRMVAALRSHWAAHGHRYMTGPKFAPGSFAMTAYRLKDFEEVEDRIRTFLSDQYALQDMIDAENKKRRADALELSLPPQTDAPQGLLKTTDEEPEPH